LFALVTATPVEVPDYGTIEFETVALDESRIIDLTNQVTDGFLHWEAPVGNSTWRIFTIWQQYTNQKSCEGGVGADTVIGNGSWIVDHFSKTGAKKITDFWDENILSDAEIANLLSETGKYGTVFTSFVCVKFINSANLCNQPGRIAWSKTPLSSGPQISQNASKTSQDIA
jgi:hypothetical protein